MAVIPFCQLLPILFFFFCTTRGIVYTMYDMECFVTSYNRFQQLTNVAGSLDAPLICMCIYVISSFCTNKLRKLIKVNGWVKHISPYFTILSWFSKKTNCFNIKFSFFWSIWIFSFDAYWRLCHFLLVHIFFKEQHNFIYRLANNPSFFPRLGTKVNYIYHCKIAESFIWL